MADAIPINRIPLSHDVMRGYRELLALPPAEPVVHPLAPARTVARMPDGRYVLAEMSGGVGAVVGKPVAASEAIELATTLLAQDLPPTPATAGLVKLAVALLGIVHDPFYNVIPFPAARGGA